MKKENSNVESTPQNSPTICESGLMLFSNSEFGCVRTLTIDNDPWFVGRDVALALGYADTKNALKAHVSQEDKRGWRIATPSGEQQMTIINESGLYDLIFGSKLDSAKSFKRWVTSDVLPTIRKTGGYVANENMFIDRYLPFADENTKAMFRATLGALEDANQQLREAKPKLETYERLAARDGLTNIRDTAKLLGIPERRFVAALEAAGLCYHDKQKKLRPYAGKGNGLFVLREYVNQKTGAHGAQTLVTFEGREYLARKFKGAEVAKS
nr:MAG TPA: hypothetical protein [Bacteriophage sp.]